MKSEFKLPDHKYRSINRTSAEDRRLSPSARGVMFYLLVQASTWKGQVYDIVHNMNCSSYAVKKAIKELVAAGYLERKHTIKKGKFTGSYYKVHEQPL